jgi:hypothetical protein
VTKAGMGKKGRKLRVMRWEAVLAKPRSALELADHA